MPEAARCLCGKTWTSRRAEHCPACHETFSGTQAGDKHRVGDFHPGWQARPTSLPDTGADGGSGPRARLTRHLVRGGAYVAAASRSAFRGGAVTPLLFGGTVADAALSKEAMRCIPEPEEREAVEYGPALTDIRPVIRRPGVPHVRPKAP